MDLQPYYDAINIIREDLGIKHSFPIHFKEVDTYWNGQLHVGFDNVINGITINTLNDDIIATLCHELRHAWQVLSGKMIISCDSRLKTIVTYEKVTYVMDLVPYDDRPWEIDAYAYEQDARQRLFLARD